MVKLISVDVLTNTYQMEGTYSFGRVQNGGGCWKGKTVNKIGTATGGGKLKLITAVCQGQFCHDLSFNSLTDDGNN